MFLVDMKMQQPLESLRTWRNLFRCCSLNNKVSLNVQCEANAVGQKGSAITQVSAQAQLNLAQEDCLAGWTDALERRSETR